MNSFEVYDEEIRFLKYIHTLNLFLWYLSYCLEMNHVQDNAQIFKDEKKNAATSNLCYRNLSRNICTYYVV